MRNERKIFRINRNSKAEKQSKAIKVLKIMALPINTEYIGMQRIFKRNQMYFMKICKYMQEYV